MQNVRRIYVVIMLIMLLLLLCGACAQQTKPQDEQPKGDIVIGIFDDFSGPLAGSGAVPYKDALLIGVRYINEEQGGILGHQLRAIVIDNKVDSSLILSGWDRLKNENATVIFTLLSGAASPIIQSAADEDHIPILAGSGSVDQVFPKEPSFFFARGPQPTGVFAPIFNMIEKDWAQKGQSRPRKRCCQALRV